MKVSKLGFSSLVLFLSLISFSCVVHPEIERTGDVEFKSSAAKKEKNLVEYISKRTVRVIKQCKVIDVKTKKVLKSYKPYSWGTGAIVLSTKNYSLVQTAAHVTDGYESENSDTKVFCDKFTLEKRDVHNKITHTYDKAVLYKKNVKDDISVLVVPENLGVSSQFASEMYVGQRVRLLGYPHLRAVKGVHLSYSTGYIMSANLGKQQAWKGSKGAVRYSAPGYFGNSGGAVWTSDGKIVGIVTSLVGFRTFGGYIPQNGCLYGLDLKRIKEFYKEKEIKIE